MLLANDSVGRGGADLITGSGANMLLIEANTFGGTGFALAYVNGAVDTYTSSQSVNFINNTFTGTATAGVDLSYDAASGNISGNSFSGSGEGAIYLGHLSQAAAHYFNTQYGTHYVFEPGTITVANNDFSHWSGADILTFDANYTLANGGIGQTLTSTVTASGQEIDTLTGVVAGDQISLNPSVTATSIHQHGKGEVDVALSDGDQLVLQGPNLDAKDVVSILGINMHVDNGNHYGFDHSHHYGYV